MLAEMYLQVSMLSDIATADGTGIRPEIMECIRISHRKARWTWLNQPEPTDQQKQDWKAAISKNFLTQGSK